MSERTLYFAYNYCPEDYSWEGTRYSRTESLFELNEKEFGCVISEHEGENIYTEVKFRGIIFSKETGEKLRDLEGSDQEEVLRKISQIPKNADITAIKTTTQVKLPIGIVSIEKYGSLILSKI